MALMDRRLQLHEELCTLLGSRNVYYQPPESIKLAYPCILYEPSIRDFFQADNVHYVKNYRYELTLIYTDPDDDIVDRCLDHFTYSRHDRHFVTDNLQHDTVVIYY